MSGDRAAPVARPRLSLYYGALFLAIGLYLPFFPLYLSAIGLTADEIGLVLTAPLLSRLLAVPFLGAFADRFATRAGALRLYAVAATAGFLALFATRDAVAIAAVLAATAAFWGALIPVADAAAVRLSRAGGPDYGRVRLWGSITFIAANLAGGWIVGALTGTAVLPLMAAGFAVTALAAFLLRLPPTDRTGGATASAGGGAPLSAWVVVAGAGLVQASHALVYAFGSIHWEGQGFPAAAIGALWATGVLAEIVLFRFAPAVTTRIAPVALVALGGIGGLVRWGAMAAEPGLAATFFLQTLHGLSFGATHLGLVHFIGATFPEGRAARAQSVAATLMGAAMAGLTAASGLLYATFGAGAFLAMAAACAAGLLALLLARPGRLATDGRSEAAS